MVEAAGRAAREAINRKTSSSASSTAAGMKKKLMTSKKQAEKEKECRTSRKQQQSTEPESPSYRLALKSLFSCRNSHGQQLLQLDGGGGGSRRRKTTKLGCSSAPSICKQLNNKDDSSDSISHSQRAAPADETACKRRASVSGGGSERRVKKPLSELPASVVSKQLQRGGSSSSSSGSSFRTGMQLRRLSGCYECHMVVDPILGGVSGSSSMRATPCPDCGEIFVRQESLQLHQSIRHAVCELGGDDTSRNIIEIIFQSSWLKKQSPVCKIQRILKVHNTPRTLARFEDYREAVKAKAAAGKTTATSSNKHPRCTADGNELLRFHCATLACDLGLDGATHLCSSSGGGCGACAIIRDGFVISKNNGGVRTMATSGRAHDALLLQEGKEEQEEERSSRAMLVCRVIAGRVKRPEEAALLEEASSPPEQEADEEGQFDSVASSAGVYSNLEELQVFNPGAILPCFVVVYKA